MKVLVKFLESVIIKPKFNLISTTTCVTDCIRNNKPWLQFMKHPYGYLHMVIVFLNFLEQYDFCHFYNVLSVFHIFTFIYVISYNMLSIWKSAGMDLPKLYHKFSYSYCKPILVGLCGDKIPTREFIIFIYSNLEFGMFV